MPQSTEVVDFFFGQLEYFSSHVQQDSVRKPLLFVLVDKQLGYCHGPHLQSDTVCLADPSTRSPASSERLTGSLCWKQWFWMIYLT